jgi:hypothetical protein
MNTTKLDNQNFNALVGLAASTRLYISTLNCKSFSNPTDAISFIVNIRPIRLS